MMPAVGPVPELRHGGIRADGARELGGLHRACNPSPPLLLLLGAPHSPPGSAPTSMVNPSTPTSDTSARRFTSTAGGRVGMGGCIQGALRDRCTGMMTWMGVWEAAGCCMHARTKGKAGTEERYRSAMPCGIPDIPGLNAGWMASGSARSSVTTCRERGAGGAGVVGAARAAEAAQGELAGSLQHQGEG